MNVSIRRAREGDARFRFTVKGAPPGPFDINITSPRGDLRGQTVSVNGKRVPAQVVGHLGRNVVVTGVCVGDVVTVGNVRARQTS